MYIPRDLYLKQLIDRQWNGQIKAITGLRRCGKSFLLNTLFRNYLLSNGVQNEHIILIELDLIRDLQYRNPLTLSAFVRSVVEGKLERFYLFIDEVQMSSVVPNPYFSEGEKITFYDALNDLRSLSNLDIYVTGSNSKMLSRDILTEFRGRSDEIRVHPLSFHEYYAYVQGDITLALQRYAQFGGMPFTLAQPNDDARMQYLQRLVKEVYLKDIIERCKIEYPDILESIIGFLASSVGSLTNPKRITDTLLSVRGKSCTKLSQNTVRSYIDALEDAFLFSKCMRYDIKGKRYLSFPQKYYSEDVGLRNAQTGFRQQEMTHLMENIIYNELAVRGYRIDVGVVDERVECQRMTREIDFIIHRGDRSVYIQSAYALPTEEKRTTELRPFLLTHDAFKKVIIRNDIANSWQDDSGVFHLPLHEFLLNAQSLD